MIILIGITLGFIAFLLLGVIILGIFFTVDLFLDLPFVGAKKDQLKTIISLSRIRRRETVVDLGSGDGRLLIAAAAKGAFAIGYELNPFLVALSLLHANLKGLSKLVKVEKENLWRADLKVADVIFVYAYRKSMKRFEDFVYKNAKKGARIVVNTNSFPNKQPLKSQNGIYLYKV